MQRKWGSFFSHGTHSFKGSIWSVDRPHFFCLFSFSLYHSLPATQFFSSSFYFLANQESIQNSGENRPGPRCSHSRQAERHTAAVARISQQLLLTKWFCVHAFKFWDSHAIYTPLYNIFEDTHLRELLGRTAQICLS